MKIYFSVDTQGFYHEGLHKNIPADAFEISQKDYNDYYTKLCNGFKATLVEGVITFTQQVLADDGKEERAWRDFELQRADLELYKVQDSDPKAFGSVSQWREYRKQLRAWPESEKFPDKTFRPEAPDYKE